MAIRKTIYVDGVSNTTTEYGVISDGHKTVSLNAYIKVEIVTASKESANVSVSFTDNDKSILKFYEFTPGLNGSNFIKQAYEHLKTLPEFKDAEDC